jgi:hypothetical protein
VSIESDTDTSRRNNPSVQRIGVTNNKLYNNGGDGVQCIGADDSGNVEYAADASDIDLLDNRIENNAENAVDIKSCQFVSIRGSVSPDRMGPAADNKLLHFRPTDPSTDLPGNNSGGGAVVIHINARFIEIENTRIWDACEGIAVGVERTQVHDLVIRRTLLFDILRGGQCPATGSAGTGIRLTNASHVDLYHLTLDNLGSRAVMVGSDNTGPGILRDVDVFNTIVSNARWWIDLLLDDDQVQGDRVVDFASDHNVFWQPGSTGTRRASSSTSTRPRCRSGAAGRARTSTAAPTIPGSCPTRRRTTTTPWAARRSRRRGTRPCPSPTWPSRRARAGRASTRPT